MAFQRKVWSDRIAEFINRRRLDHEDGTSELVSVAREEGTIMQTGDSFSAATMNDMEQRIDDAFGGISFGYTEDGKPGYKEAGADSVVPFSSGGLYIPELKMSGHISAHGTPLSNEASDLTLNTEDYTSLTMSANLSANVGYVQLFVYDATTSAILYQSTRWVSVRENVSVDVSSNASVRVRIVIDGIGSGYGGPNSLTLTDITLS